MPVIPLDIPAAVKLLAKAGANAAVQTGNPNLIFTGDITDPTGETPADVFYPALRRDDAPIIEFVEGGVRISVGKVHAGEAPGADPDSEADAIAAREGAFWKKPGSRDAESIVNENYGKVIRHMAPIIEFKEREGDVFGFSLGMGKVTGELVDTEVPAGLYPEKDRFYAPLIQLNPPAYENDASSYVKVSSAEVQLPIVEAVSLRSSM